MKIRKLQMPAALLAVLIVTLACGFNVSTARITNARMTADEAGAQETTVFAPDQDFYCIVDLANAPEDTTLGAVWTAVNVEGEEPNLLIDETELQAGDQNEFTFSLTNEGDWPPGQYKVDIYLNEELERTLEFEVR